MTHYLENTVLGCSVQTFPLKYPEQQGKGKVFGGLGEEVERRNMTALPKCKISLKFLYFTMKIYPTLAIDTKQAHSFFYKRFYISWNNKKDAPGTCCVIPGLPLLLKICTFSLQHRLSWMINLPPDCKWIYHRLGAFWLSDNHSAQVRWMISSRRWGYSPLVNGHMSDGGLLAFL